MYKRQASSTLLCAVETEEGGKGVRGKKDYGTRGSQAVSHPGTNRARPCLTSVFGREPVCSRCYGRSRKPGILLGVNIEKCSRPPVLGWILGLVRCSLTCVVELTHFTRVILIRNFSFNGATREETNRRLVNLTKTPKNSRIISLIWVGCYVE